MKICEQTKGQSLYDHGISVYEYFKKLISNETEGMKIPEWFNNNFPLHDEQTIKDYLVYHDCGKFLCKDENGRFPNHAEVSKKLYLEVTGNETVANLIGWDMALHTASAIEIEELCKIWTTKDALTLVVAALAEIHSNASFFGGFESISFKSKWKQIDRRGKQILRSKHVLSK
jgi:hypothetical protein